MTTTNASDLKVATSVAEHQEDYPVKKEPVVFEDDRNTREKSPAERSLLIKIDLLIIPTIILIALVNQWDKSAIGNARVMGMQKDIHMTDGQYYTAISLYYVGFVLCTIPANLFMRFFKAHRQMGTCVVLFAVFCCCMAAAKNAGTILALRILFGFATPFYQAIALFMTMWYKRNEVATRNGIVTAFTVLAGAFSGFIAYGVYIHLDGAMGRPAWQWLFIIEGVCGIVIGIGAWIILPPAPDQMKNDKHWVFTSEELQAARERLRTYNEEGARFKWQQMWPTLKDPKTIAFALINAGVAPAIGSIAAFLPSFISAFGYSPAKTQLFTVIPYACAFVIFLSFGYISDRYDCRGLLLALCMSFSSVGYIILICAHNIPVKIFATCLVTMGAYPALPLMGAWAVINTGGYTKRATTYGLLEMVGQCVAIGTSHAYTDPPQYVQGHSILLSLQLLALICTVANWVWMKRLNQLKDQETARHAAAGTIHPDAHKSLEEVMDFHPNFRYRL